jgi:hypothetical protein
MRDFAASRGTGAAPARPERPPVAIVTSQAAQLSVLRDLQIEAQQVAVRALVRDNHQPAFVLAETAGGGATRLGVLPAPQALTEAGWRRCSPTSRAAARCWSPAPSSATSTGTAPGGWAALAPGGRRGAGRPRGRAAAGRARVPCPFSLKAQSWLGARSLPRRRQLKELPHGQGGSSGPTLPVELAESGEAARALYAHVLARAGVSAP